MGLREKQPKISHSKSGKSGRGLWNPTHLWALRSARPVTLGELFNFPGKCTS